MAILPDLSTFANPGGQASPWFTVANQFLPRNLHDVIRWVRYITIQSPVTTEVIRKQSTYPITEFVVDSSNEIIKERYKAIFKSFKMKQVLQDIGFDYYTIGNVFISVFFPIHRTLTCPSCKTSYNAKKANFIKFQRYEYNGTCPSCEYTGPFKRKDTKSLDIKDMNLIKWNPQHISVNYNPITGESEYYYRIPNEIRRKVQQGDSLYVNSIPWGFIDAIRYNQDFKFDAENIFHLRNVSTGSVIEGISIPPLVTLFSLVFYQATLRKANEAIATEYLNPMRVVFPQAQTGNSDPVVSMSLKNFAGNMQEALQKHKRDKNHFLIAPVPIGYQTVGGEGKNLLVSQEIQQAEQSILLSLGVSQELLSGTTNWTSSTVGLRMLENTMHSYVTQLTDVINWVMTKVASYLSMEVCNVSMTPFKLMDDDVFKQQLMALVQSGEASISSLYEAMGLDYTDELFKIKEDKISKAKANIEATFEIEQAEFAASKDISKRLADDSNYKDLLRKATELATQLSNTDPSTMQSILVSMKLDNYPLYLLTIKLMNEGVGVNPNPEDPNDPNSQGGTPADEEQQGAVQSNSEIGQGEK